VDNYFNYFTQIEEHFQRRRGRILLLSTLDWALIETWKDAGIPLEAALRGIDAAFDRYEQRPSRSKKVNSLAYCAQEVLAAAKDMKEAAVGATQISEPQSGVSGFDNGEIAAFLRRNAQRLEDSRLPSGGSTSPEKLARESAITLRELAEQLSSNKEVRLEEIERRLTVLEEKLFAALLAATPDDELVSMRALADRELSPYRNKMSAPQIDQLLKQYVQKRLLEKFGLPRLSLFYL
jgi:hypothetical protein